MKRFIIDGFNLAYRSHFAFKDLSTSTGLFSGSIYGFLTTMRALKRRFPDFQFYVVWDNEPTTKKNAYAGYKANRIPFRVDFPIRDLKDILKCVKVVQAEMENEEADDVIASVVRADGNMDYIYSSDKDLLQLVKDGSVVVISPKVGRNEEKIYDEEAVRGKFGVGPKDLARFLAFRGDTVDNIPGAVRVHSKVIASLCNKYGSVREIYENLPGSHRFLRLIVQLVRYAQPEPRVCNVRIGPGGCLQDCDGFRRFLAREVDVRQTQGHRDVLRIEFECPLILVQRGIHALVQLDGCRSSEMRHCCCASFCSGRQLQRRRAEIALRLWRRCAGLGHGSTARGETQHAADHESQCPRACY